MVWVIWNGINNFVSKLHCCLGLYCGCLEIVSFDCMENILINLSSVPFKIDTNKYYHNMVHISQKSTGISSFLV